MELNQTAMELVGQVWQNADIWETHYRKAVALLRSALKMEPENIITLTNLGTALCDTGKYQQARLFLEKAITLGSQDYNTYFNLAVAIINSSDEDAMPFFSRAVGKEPSPHTWAAYFDPQAH